MAYSRKTPTLGPGQDLRNKHTGPSNFTKVRGSGIYIPSVSNGPNATPRKIQELFAGLRNNVTRRPGN